MNDGAKLKLFWLILAQAQQINIRVFRSFLIMRIIANKNVFTY